MNKKSLLGLVIACLFAAPFAFGAEAVIVYNPSNGTFGSFRGTYSSRYQAEQGALEECGAHCNNLIDPNILEEGQSVSGLVETYTDVYGGWVAIAKSASNPALFGASGCDNPALLNCHDSSADAENTALSACADKGANDCQIVRAEEAY